jgi:hypothetical protein
VISKFYLFRKMQNQRAVVETLGECEVLTNFLEELLENNNDKDTLERALSADNFCIVRRLKSFEKSIDDFSKAKDVSQEVRCFAKKESDKLKKIRNLANIFVNFTVHQSEKTEYSLLKEDGTSRKKHTSASELLDSSKKMNREENTTYLFPKKSRSSSKSNDKMYPIGFRENLLETPSIQKKSKKDFFQNQNVHASLTNKPRSNNKNQLFHLISKKNRKISYEYKIQCTSRTLSGILKYKPPQVPTKWITVVQEFLCGDSETCILVKYVTVKKIGKKHKYEVNSHLFFSETCPRKATATKIKRVFMKKRSNTIKNNRHGTKKSWKGFLSITPNRRQVFKESEQQFSEKWMKTLQNLLKSKLDFETCLNVMFSSRVGGKPNL